MSHQPVFVLSVLFLAASCVLGNRVRDETALQAEQEQMGASCSLGTPIINNNVSAPMDMCKICTGKGCKWCPLTQTCISKCTLAARATFSKCECDERPENNPLDARVKEPKGCPHKAPWQEALDELLGEDWATSEKYAKNLDAVRCLQWIHGAPLAREGEGIDKQTDEEAGTWGCFSALLRHGMMQLYKSSPGTQERESGKQNADGWYLDRETFKPKLCELYKTKNKGECYVRDWKIDQFKKIRDLYPEMNNALRLEIERGPVIPFSPGAGKSGSGFGYLGSKTSGFVVKMGLKYAAKMNEPENLMQLIEPPSSLAASGAVGLVEHLERHPHSHLNKPFGMLKIALGAARSYAVILDQCFFGMDRAASALKEQGVDFARYDLKGASRNQNEENDDDEFALVNGNFRRRENATLHLTDDQCMSLRNTVKADSDFLEHHKMIDYSLALLSVNKPTSLPREKDLHCPGNLQEPSCMEHGNHLYTVSIIDYFNSFNAYKGLESAFRGGKFTNYAKKIQVYIKKICRTEAERDLRATVQQILLGKKRVRDIFKEIDQDHSRTVTWDELENWLKAQQLDASKFEDLEDTMQSLDSFDKHKEGLTLSAFEEVFRYLLD
eukprot:TRINITY_DN102855_c0_g1_i1.p1 TRINITY_DN102855_c0_g1~~TRINITY_DN102855_c0_g1_i1.p1  ORF type:complete len:652 (-),score=123.06 TRINITY_DN102855_c0_g1_i1:41-1873(-)